MFGRVRVDLDAVRSFIHDIRMTHTILPADCQTLVRVRHPQQACRYVRPSSSAAARPARC